ncbi:MAG TPA: proline--tRNA ligase [bacterium]|nr:proline--tRNA ligase [bacterium]
MRMTRMFLPTLREVPAEAEVVSHKLMLRSGMVRKVASGIYTWLPLGLRVLRRVEQIVREEMDRAGAQELSMPMVQPSELWRESGRWDAYGPELARLRDRHQREFCLGPTHEEVITSLVRGELRSYRDLPQNLYQIQNKFRDEVRPRFGVMRGREFGMKDAYSFDADDAGAEKSYQDMFDAYTRIFTRCGLKFRPVEAVTGQIGGSFSHEFMVLADAGESGIAACDACGYAATLEKAESMKQETAGAGEAEKAREKVSTPGQHTALQVAAFLTTTPDRVVKTLIYETNQGPVAAMVRGDRELNEEKLQIAAGAWWVRLAEPAAISDHTGGPVGFSGPVGLKLPLYLDRELEGEKNFVTGANEADTHYVNVNPSRDFTPTAVADLKTVAAGDPCPRCGGPLAITRGIEVGQVFKLGLKYSKSMDAKFLDPEGKEQYMVMGCYGIGTGRTVAASIEQNHDERGIIWPAALAPYHVYLLPVNVNDDKVRAAADRLDQDLTAAGLEVLHDDRDERAGVKFNDADLLGIPLRIVVGAKNLKDGKVELKPRRDQDARLIALDRARAAAEEFFKKEKGV